MQIAPTTGGPPNGLGMALSGPDGFGAARFFALIQSLFANRPEPVASRKAAPDGRVELRGKSGPDPSGRPDPYRGGPRLRESDDGHADAPEPTRQPEDPAVREVAGQAPAPAEADPATDRQDVFAGTIRQVVQKLKKLLARIEEGLAPPEAFAQMLKILTVLQQLADQIPHDQLAQFFRDLGPEFEPLVARIAQVHEKIEAGRERPAFGLFAAAKRGDSPVDAGTVEDLARSLAQVLGRALRPAAQPAAPEAVVPVREQVLAADPSKAGAAPHETDAEAAVEADVPGESVLAQQKKAVPARQEQEPPALARAAAAPTEGPARPVIVASNPAAPAPAADLAEQEGGPGLKTASVESERSGAVAAKLSQAPLRLRADQIASIDRLVKMAQLSTQAGAGRLRIRLNPPQLGNLRMDLSVRDGVLTGSLRVETPAARAAVLTQVNDLKATLSEQGIQVGEFQVSVDHRGEPSRDGSGEDASGRPRWNARAAARESAAAQDPGTTERASYVDHRV